MSVKTIMVVEDENIIALDIKNRLRKLGYDILAVVPSGEQAVELAKRVRPDLVLMDIVLRGNLDGVKAAELITNQNNIPIIFITSFSDEDTLNQVLKVAHHGYIIKPFNERELKSKIDQIQVPA